MRLVKTFLIRGILHGLYSIVLLILLLFSSICNNGHVHQPNYIYLFILKVLFFY